MTWGRAAALTSRRAVDRLKARFELTDFSQTFAENEILLTGANGFVGKVILALLLDRYPQAQRVHVLVRPRGGRRRPSGFARMFWIRRLCVH